MLGMGIAVVTTLVTHEIASLAEIAIAIAIGGGVGYVIARRISMTAMPQLVAAFHSLVGMAAVLVAAAAYMNPDAFGITDAAGILLPVSRIEMGLGMAIGAITFSGSVIAFAKLNGNMSGAPIMLPARHVIKSRPAGRYSRADRVFLRRRIAAGRCPVAVLDGDRTGFPDRLSADHPDRRRGHAGRDLDAQQLFGLGGGGDGFHAGQYGDDHHRRFGRQLGRDPQLHHVQGDEPKFHQRHRRRFRRGERRRRKRARRSTGPGNAAAPRMRPF